MDDIAHFLSDPTRMNIIRNMIIGSVVDNYYTLATTIPKSIYLRGLDFALILIFVLLALYLSRKAMNL